MKMLKIALVSLVALSLAGCGSLSTTHTDQYGDTYVKGVVYYDRNGVLQDAVPEAISPQAQDNWETFGWIATPIMAVGGAATGIVALTN